MINIKISSFRLDLFLITSMLVYTNQPNSNLLIVLILAFITYVILRLSYNILIY